ncbi:MAG: T3SS effector HopA1 family protein [Candidatus Nitrosocosmicus sp.]
MSSRNKEIQKLISMINILSNNRFTFNDQIYGPTISNAGIRGLNVTAAALIYDVYHCRKEVPFSPNPDSYTQRDVQDFTSKLSSSNMGTGPWDPGWKVVEVETDGDILVRKTDLTLRVHSHHFKSISSNAPLVGSVGMIKMVKGFKRLFPGFYMVNGNTLPPQNQRNDVILRFYWNIVPRYSSFMVNIISRDFNNLKIPFKFKILNDPFLYPRADAGVLYISKSVYSNSINLILDVYKRVNRFLYSSTPLFAKRLAPGLSMAEDPNNGESFGMDRSKTLADAIFKSHKESSASKVRIHQIRTYFLKSGIDLKYPYLNMGSKDEYDIEIGIG